MNKIFPLIFVLLLSIQVIKISSEPKVKQNIPKSTERRLQDYELVIEVIFENPGTTQIDAKIMYKDTYIKLTALQDDFECEYFIDDESSPITCTGLPTDSDPTLPIPPGKKLTMTVKARNIPTGIASVPNGGGDIKMFKDCNNLIEARIIRYSSANLVNMGVFFENDRNLKKVTFESTMDPIGLLRFSYMFRNCTSIEEVDLSTVNWEGGSEFRYFDQMFNGTTNIKTINMGNVKVSSPYSNYPHYGSFLAGCVNLCQIKFPTIKNSDHAPLEHLYASQNVDNVRYVYNDEIQDGLPDKNKVNYDVNYNTIQKTCTRVVKLTVAPKHEKYDGVTYKFKLGTVDFAPDTGEDSFELLLTSPANPGKATCKIAKGKTDVFCEITAGDLELDGEKVKWDKMTKVSSQLFYYDEVADGELPLPITHEKILLTTDDTQEHTYKDKIYAFKIKAEFAPAASTDVTDFTLATEDPELKDKITCSTKVEGGLISCTIKDYEPKDEKTVALSKLSPVGTVNYYVKIDDKIGGDLKLKKFEIFKINEIKKNEYDPVSGKYNIELDMEIFPHEKGKTFTMKLDGLDDEVTCEMQEENQPVQCSFTPSKVLNDLTVSIPTEIEINGEKKPLESDKPELTVTQPIFEVKEVKNHKYDPDTNEYSFELDYVMKPFKPGESFTLKMDGLDDPVTCETPANEGDPIKCSFTPKDKIEDGQEFTISKEQEIGGVPFKAENPPEKLKIEHRTFKILNIDNRGYDEYTKEYKFDLEFEMKPFVPNEEFTLKMDDLQDPVTCKTPAKEEDRIQCSFKNSTKLVDEQEFTISKVQTIGDTPYYLEDSVDKLQIEIEDPIFNILNIDNRGYDKEKQEYNFELEYFMKPFIPEKEFTLKLDGINDPVTCKTPEKEGDPIKCSFKNSTKLVDEQEFSISKEQEIDGIPFTSDQLDVDRKLKVQIEPIFEIKGVINHGYDKEKQEYKFDLDYFMEPFVPGQEFTLKMDDLKDPVTCKTPAKEGDPIQCSFKNSTKLENEDEFTISKEQEIGGKIYKTEHTVDKLQIEIQIEEEDTNTPKTPIFEIKAMQNQVYDPTTNTLTFDLDVHMEPYQPGHKFKLQLEDPEAEAECEIPEKEGDPVKCQFKPKEKPKDGQFYRIKQEQDIGDTKYALKGMRSFNGLDNTEPYINIVEIKHQVYDEENNRLTFDLDVKMYPYKHKEKFHLKLEDPETEAICIVPEKEGDLVTCEYEPKEKPHEGKIYKIQAEETILSTKYRIYGQKTFDGLKIHSMAAPNEPTEPNNTNPSNNTTEPVIMPHRRLVINSYFNQSYDEAAKRYHFKIEGSILPLPEESPYEFNLTFQGKEDIQVKCNYTHNDIYMPCYLNMNGKKLEKGEYLVASSANDTAEQPIEVIDVTGLYLSGFKVEQEVVDYEYNKEKDPLITMFIVQFFDHREEEKKENNTTIIRLFFVTEVIIINQQLPENHEFDLYVTPLNRLRHLQDQQTAKCKLKTVDPFVKIDAESYYAYYDCDLENPKSSRVQYAGTDPNRVRATTGEKTNTVIDPADPDNKSFNDVFNSRSNQLADHIEINLLLPDTGKSYGNGTYSFEAEITCDPNNENDLCEDPFYLNDKKIVCYKQSNGKYLCFANEDSFDEDGNLNIVPYLYNQEPPALIKVKKKGLATTTMNAEEDFSKTVAEPNDPYLIKNYEKGDGLKSGYIVLIVLASLLAIAIATGVYMYSARKKKEEQEKEMKRMYQNSSCSLYNISTKANKSEAAVVL